MSHNILLPMEVLMDNKLLSCPRNKANQDNTLFYTCSNYLNILIVQSAAL